MVGASSARRSSHRENGRVVSGRGGLGRAQVAQIQRARMVSAMTEVVLELGAGSVSVADVVERSGVSRRTFYESFRDRDECFLAAFDDALERISAVVVPAFETGGGWRERVRIALGELLGFLDQDPGVGRLLIVESLAAGPQALERRHRVLRALIVAVDEGRGASATSELPPLTAEGVVGAVCSILYARLLSNSSTGMGDPDSSHMNAGSLAWLTSELMGMIVLPYLGKAAARRELERPVPARHALAPRSGVGVYPFRELGMRLTYRTMCVLDAIACNRDASNRLLGEASGIPDQGQISKLLARLERLGLIENVVGVPGRGGPNAWRLTEKGRTVHAAIQTSKASVSGS